MNDLAEHTDFNTKIEQLVRLGLLPVGQLPFLKKALAHVQLNMFLPVQERKIYYQFINTLLEVTLGNDAIYRLVKNKVASRADRNSAHLDEGMDGKVECSECGKKFTKKEGVKGAPVCSECKNSVKESSHDDRNPYTGGHPADFAAWIGRKKDKIHCMGCDKAYTPGKSVKAQVLCPTCRKDMGEQYNLSDAELDALLERHEGKESLSAFLTRKGTSNPIGLKKWIETKKTPKKVVKEGYEGFGKLKGELKSKGDKNPSALAAWIGRKKYGKGKFDAAAHNGKKLGEELVIEGFTKKQISGYQKAEIARSKDPMRLSGITANDEYNKSAFGITKDEHEAMRKKLVDKHGAGFVPHWSDPSVKKTLGESVELGSYSEHFDNALKQFGVTNISELDPEKTKELLAFVDESVVSAAHAHKTAEMSDEIKSQVARDIAKRTATKHALIALAKGEYDKAIESKKPVSKERELFLKDRAKNK